MYSVCAHFRQSNRSIPPFFLSFFLAPSSAPFFGCLFLPFLNLFFYSFISFGFVCSGLLQASDIDRLRRTVPTTVKERCGWRVVTVSAPPRRSASAAPGGRSGQVPQGQAPVDVKEHLFVHLKSNKVQGKSIDTRIVVRCGRT
jgi:hypothetical protein